MEIQLIHRLVHSDGNVHTVYEPGDIYECSAADAKILIEQGSAVALEEIKAGKYADFEDPKVRQSMKGQYRLGRKK